MRGNTTGELATLAALGIRSISLAATNYAPGTQVNGNDLLRYSTVTYTNGTMRRISEIGLDVDHIHSKPVVPVVIPPDVQALPWLHGYGDMMGLDASMVRDA